MTETRISPRRRSSRGTRRRPSPSTPPLSWKRARVLHPGPRGALGGSPKRTGSASVGDGHHGHAVGDARVGDRGGYSGARRTVSCSTTTRREEKLGVSNLSSPVVPVAARDAVWRAQRHATPSGVCTRRPTVVFCDAVNASFNVVGRRRPDAEWNFAEGRLRDFGTARLGALTGPRPYRRRMAWSSARSRRARATTAANLAAYLTYPARAAIDCGHQYECFAITQTVKERVSWEHRSPAAASHSSARCTFLASRCSCDARFARQAARLSRICGGDC